MASRACCTSGSDMAGFSPWMYIALITPSWIACMISTTVKPRFGASPGPQRCLNARADLVVLDAAIIWEEHRDEAGVRRALHVVLPAQWMQPRCPAVRSGQ